MFLVPLVTRAHVFSFSFGIIAHISTVFPQAWPWCLLVTWHTASAHFCSPHWPHYLWRTLPVWLLIAFACFLTHQVADWGQKDKGAFYTRDKWLWGCRVFVGDSGKHFYICCGLLNLCPFPGVNAGPADQRGKILLPRHGKRQGQST